MNTKQLTDKEVIKKCVEIAIEGGYENIKCTDVQIEVNNHFDIRIESKLMEMVITGSIHFFLFDHDFCKALFGVKDTCQDCGVSYSYPVKVEGYDYDFYECECEASVQVSPIELWQYHIQQLALSEDRIDYLRQYLENLNN
jgi:hypothetical protein